MSVQSSSTRCWARTGGRGPPSRRSSCWSWRSSSGRASTSRGPSGTRWPPPSASQRPRYIRVHIFIELMFRCIKNMSDMSALGLQLKPFLTFLDTLLGRCSPKLKIFQLNSLKVRYKIRQSSKDCENPPITPGRKCANGNSRKSEADSSDTK